MSPWLSLMIIVLVAVALFADNRRNSIDELPDVAGHDELPSTAFDSALRPNVRAVHENGHHPTSVPRPLPARRAGRSARKPR